MVNENESKVSGSEFQQKQDPMWAKIGDGRWYAIPSSMAESFRKAGADVRLVPEQQQ